MGAINKHAALHKGLEVETVSSQGVGQEGKSSVGANLCVMFSPQIASGVAESRRGIPFAPTTSSVFAALTLLMVLCSCAKDQRKASSVPTRLSMSDSIRFQYAVYILPSLPAHRVKAAMVLHEVLKRHPELNAADELPKEPQGMMVHAYVQDNVKKQYAPPGVKSLQYFGRGISRDQAQALQNTDKALVLDFGHPKKDVWTALRAATELVEEFARKTGGLVWDEQTREVFSPDDWHQKRLGSWVGDVPDVSSQIAIHAYSKGESVRASTLGMSKMGLRDIVVEESGWSSNDQMGNLINFFCQAIAQGKPFGESGDFRLVLDEIKNTHVRDNQMKSLKANATGTACVTLKQGRWEEGDPKNRLIQLAPDKYSGNDESAKQDALFSSLFGSEDSVHKIRHNDELLAASARANEKLPELQKAFSAGLEPGEFIELKAPFTTPDGGNEWMWVEVRTWKDKEIDGLLQNDPVNVPNLHAGQQVKIRQEDVFDYIRHFPNKKAEGNATGDIITKMDENANSTGKQESHPVVPACGDN